MGTHKISHREVRLHHVQLAYGDSLLKVALPEDGVVWLTEQQSSATAPSEERLLHRALQMPYGLPRLSQLVRPGQRVAILVSDITRPCPTARLIPPLLSELARAGVDDKHTHIIFALGSHRQQTAEEQSRLVGDTVFPRIRCEDTDQEQCVEVGRTRRGTPVHVFRPALEADWRVYVGNIEYHYFAGYTGGAKALLPGACSVETISANHSWMVHDSAAAGRIEGNPVREDQEGAATLVGPAFLWNVVLDGQRRIVEAVAGDVTLAHRQGCRKVDELYRVPLAERADIILASAGGWPKDINFYQAHKSLENAAPAVRDGGILILVAECREGIGHARFAEWLTCGDSPERLLQRIQQQFVLGGHKAAAIAKTRRRAVRIFLVSSMDAELVRSMGFTPHASAQAALDAARSEMGHAALLAVMPHAGSVLPALANPVPGFG